MKIEKNNSKKYMNKIYCLMKKCFHVNEVHSLLPLLESEFGEIYMFKKNTILIGFAALINIKQISHIIYFCVDPKYQNLGFGAEMLKMLLIIKENNNIIADLGDPNQKNISEQEQVIRIRRNKFYRKLGFVNTLISYEWCGVKYLICSTKYIEEKEFWDFWKSAGNLQNIY